MALFMALAVLEEPRAQMTSLVEALLKDFNVSSLLQILCAVPQIP